MSNMFVEPDANADVRHAVSEHIDGLMRLVNGGYPCDAGERLLLVNAIQALNTMFETVEAGQ